MDAIADTISTFAGAHLLSDFNTFGRSVSVRVEATSGDTASDLKSLKVRNVKGDMVPLSALIAVRDIEGPLSLDFLDSLPMVQVTANPAAGADVEKTRKFCETLAEEVRKEMNLPRDYRLTWLQEPVKNK